MASHAARQLRRALPRLARGQIFPSSSIVSENPLLLTSLSSSPSSFPVWNSVQECQISPVSSHNPDTRSMFHTSASNVISLASSFPPFPETLPQNQHTARRSFSVRVDLPPEAANLASSASGNGLGSQGEQTEAELPVDFMEDLVKSTEETFGEHQFTATVYLKLAQAYYREGHEGGKVFAAASRAWKWFDEHAEKDDLVRVMCLHLLASSLHRMQKPDEALRYLEAALKIPDNDKSKGDHAMMMFATHMLIGDSWTLLNGQQKAKQAYTTALGIQEKALGPTDARVGDTCRHLAEAHAQLMEFEEAEGLALRALDIHVQTAGEGSMEEAIDRRLLAAVYAGLEEPEKALGHLEATRGIVAESRGGLDAALTDVAIGDMLVAMGKPEEAIVAFEAALKRQVAVLGEEHATVAATYAAAADAYLKAGNKTKAQSVCEKAMKMYEAGNGDDPVETANGLTELAHIYEAMENLPKAADLFRQAIEMRLQVPGQLLTVAGTESNLGLVLLSMGLPREARQAFDSCLAKLEAAYGGDHPSIASALHYVATAVVRGSKGEAGPPGDALAALERAKGIVDRANIGNSMEGVEVYEGLVPLLAKNGRWDEAIKCQEQVAKVKEGSYGSRHPEVIKAKSELQKLQDGKP